MASPAPATVSRVFHRSGSKIARSLENREALLGLQMFSVVGPYMPQ
jgi:hypothetical protein